MKWWRRPTLSLASVASSTAPVAWSVHARSAQSARGRRRCGLDGARELLGGWMGSLGISRRSLRGRYIQGWEMLDPGEARPPMPWQVTALTANAIASDLGPPKVDHDS
eukprot:1122073-Pyramimonas_sp.AAC.1